MNFNNDSSQVKLLFLLSSSKDNVDKLVGLVKDPENLFIENSHKIILKASIWCRDKDKSLTTEQFEYFCKFISSIPPQKMAVLAAELAAIQSIDSVSQDDLEVLIEECCDLCHDRYCVGFVDIHNLTI